MKTMKDYHNLYLQCDNLLLLGVFKNFLKNYGLCPRHYLSAMALSCDPILKGQKLSFELISDADMYLVFEKSMRGGVSYISERYCKASNKHLKCYDTKRKS